MAQSKVNQAKQAGAQARANDQACAPALCSEMMQLLAGLPVGKESTQLLRAWQQGWHDEDERLYCSDKAQQLGADAYAAGVCEYKDHAEFVQWAQWYSHEDRMRLAQQWLDGYNAAQRASLRAAGLQFGDAFGELAQLVMDATGCDSAAAASKINAVMSNIAEQVDAGALRSA
jgi:hypothetical protein